MVITNCIHYFIARTKMICIKFIHFIMAFSGVCTRKLHNIKLLPMLRCQDNFIPEIVVLKDPRTVAAGVPWGITFYSIGIRHIRSPTKMITQIFKYIYRSACGLTTKSRIDTTWCDGKTHHKVQNIKFELSYESLSYPLIITFYLGLLWYGYQKLMMFKGCEK